MESKCIISSINLLARKIKQQTLKPDIIRVIKANIGGNNETTINKALEAISIIVTFINSTGSNFINNDTDMQEMLLTKYASDILVSDNDDSFCFFSNTIKQNIKLQHIESLLDTLYDCQNESQESIFSNVRSKYKQKLTQADLEGAKTLKAIISKQNLDSLLPVMKRSIQQRLTEDYTAAEESAKVFFSFCEINDEYLAEVEWFMNAFPSFIKMKCVVEFYKQISN